MLLKATNENNMATIRHKNS